MRVTGLVGQAAAGKAAAASSAAKRARIMPLFYEISSVQELAFLVDNCQVDETRAVVAFSAVVDPEVAQVDLEAGQRARQPLAGGLLRAGALESFAERARRDVAFQAGEREQRVRETRAVVALVLLDQANVALGGQRHHLGEHLALRKPA